MQGKARKGTGARTSKTPAGGGEFLQLIVILITAFPHMGPRGLQIRTGLRLGRADFLVLEILGGFPAEAGRV